MELRCYCFECKKVTTFYCNAKDDKYHCQDCDTLFVPSSRRYRRGLKTDKHTWEPEYKRR